MIQWEEELDPRQLEAVTHLGGPAQVVAGPGSGKTRVLTYRIAHLISQAGVEPTEILALTFTKKAAGEMKERIAILLSDQAAAKITAQTIHAWCYASLRRNAARDSASDLVAAWDGTIMQNYRQKVAWEMAVGEPKASKVKPGHVGKIVEMAKNNGLTREAYRARGAEEQAENYTAIADAWLRYDQIKMSSGKKDGASALDFEDMLLEAREQLRRDPDLAERTRAFNPHILVDEAQDLNPVQWNLFEILAPPPGGELMVVGDADQAIYAFRGAVPEDLVRFDQKWSTARTYILDRNYRSTPKILDAANRLITNNLERHEKELWTDKTTGAHVELEHAASPEDEADTVIRAIRDATSTGHSFRDCAVLVRCWWQTRAMEDALLKNRIPYIVIGGPSFYARREIRDILAYLEIATDPENGDEALGRIFNVPNRYLGAAARAILEDYAERQDTDLYSALPHAPWTKPYMKEAAEELSWIITRLWRLARTEPPARVIEAMISYTRYEEYLRKEPDGEDRIENVHELIDASTNFESAHDLVFYAKQVEDSQPSKEQNTNAVELMTVHRAKGKEFHTVATIGFVDGIFPHERSDDLEEERRIAFVAMTRAEERLLLTSSRYYRTKTYDPSPFLAEAGILPAVEQAHADRTYRFCETDPPEPE